ncbi:MAG: hypothetical protein ACRDZY_09465, partial [Acidimicrobiales bacterium]
MTTEDEALIQRPPPKPQPTTAQAMIGMLRKHYIHNETHPAWACMPEIQAPGPTGRRADLICLG